MGVLGWLNCMGMLGWFKWVGVLGWLELACPTACTCLFKVRLEVLNKTLSHMWGELNLTIFLFNVGLFTLINLYPKVLEVSPMYSSSQVRSPHWEPVYGPTFVDHGVFFLGGDQ